MKDLKGIVATIQKQAVPVPASLQSAPNGKAVPQAEPVYGPPVLKPTPSPAGGVNPWKGQQPATQPQSTGFTPAKSADFDIRTMQEKLVALSNTLKNSDAVLKHYLQVDDDYINTIGIVGTDANPNEEDGIWGTRTTTAIVHAKLIAIRMIAVATEHNITIPLDENMAAGLGTAVQHKSAKTVSAFIDKMMLAVPELVNAMPKAGKQLSANELSYAEKARLTELYNEVAATITLPRGGQVQVMFADIASQEAFQKFVEKNKIKMPGRVLKLISNEIQKQPGAIPASVRPKAL